MAEENTPTKRRNTRRKRTSTKQQSKSQSFSLRSEVKGLIVIAFAVISFLGFFGFELGLVGCNDRVFPIFVSSCSLVARS